MSEKKAYRILFSDRGRSLIDPALVANARIGQCNANPIQLATEQLQYDPVYFIDLTMNIMGTSTKIGPLARNTILEYADEATRDTDYRALQDGLAALCGITITSARHFPAVTAASDVEKPTV